MVTVVMTTYNPEPSAPRFKYMQRCVDALGENIPQPKALIVADDGSPEPLDVRWHATQWQKGVTSITGVHDGIGTSLNRAMRLLMPDEPWIYTTDDWLLTDELDLALPLHLLDIGYDLVRLGPIHPNVSCTTRFEYPWGWWLDLDVHSNQYTCATRPFLASPRLMQKVVSWTQGVDSYQAEIDFGRECQEGDVRAAAINLAGPWEHIGEYEVGDRPVVTATALPNGKGDTNA